MRRGFDEGAGRYLGLVLGERPIVSVPDGIDEQTQRVIKENANALGVAIRVR